MVTSVLSSESIVTSAKIGVVLNRDLLVKLSGELENLGVWPSTIENNDGCPNHLHAAGVKFCKIKLDLQFNLGRMIPNFR